MLIITDYKARVAALRLVYTGVIKTWRYHNSPALDIVVKEKVLTRPLIRHGGGGGKAF